MQLQRCIPIKAV